MRFILCDSSNFLDLRDHFNHHKFLFHLSPSEVPTKSVISLLISLSHTFHQMV